MCPLALCMCTPSTMSRRLQGAPPATAAARRGCLRWPRSSRSRSHSRARLAQAARPSSAWREARRHPSSTGTPCGSASRRRSRPTETCAGLQPRVRRADSQRGALRARLGRYRRRPTRGHDRRPPCTRTKPKTALQWDDTSDLVAVRRRSHTLSFEARLQHDEPTAARRSSHHVADTIAIEVRGLHLRQSPLRDRLGPVYPGLGFGPPGDRRPRGDLHGLGGRAAAAQTLSAIEVVKVAIPQAPRTSSRAACTPRPDRRTRS